MESSFLIVGLGNPGKKYKRTRHNVGFMVIDAIASRQKKTFTKIDDIYWACSYQNQNKHIILMKPATYMNLSGQAVASGMARYNIDLSRLLVICDDINLEFGTIRIRSKGSDGGQKGLRSIISVLATQDFPRLRIGIGDHFSDAVEYVLSRFSKKEDEFLVSIIAMAADAVDHFILNNLELAMSRFNRNYLEN
jgi:PTH1 family peptidyl-tRNA hydrolase